MNCREFLQLLFEFRCEELGPDDTARCCAHLARCARCRRELRATEGWLAAMRTCCKPEKMPARLRNKLRDRVASGSGPMT